MLRLTRQFNKDALKMISRDNQMVIEDNHMIVPRFIPEIRLTSTHAPKLIFFESVLRRKKRTSWRPMSKSTTF